ncbi:MAG: glutathione S-transferase [Hydrocarboniphaga sp.]|uniref:glutathione S-transferase family protein n=1 Tax=Hydrocarboniphaga sp. TaxID=2033016 RepID=UPI002604C38A|nr:glutathione S-transferase family protein [Hydrocarboniphaga sp.]MDB5968565.1 glutathione S-transferase [Hydrocarboniphaga sp.]
MILIGMFDSPFVRRVAVSMNLLGLPFEHRNWSVGRDQAAIREYNPLGRVPTLVLDDGTSLCDSFALLDYLDQFVGPGRALLPPTGLERRDALQLMALASGVAEKGVLQAYERIFRPAERQHQPWVDRCAEQMHGALALLELACAAKPGDWLIGERLTQADVSTVTAWTFVVGALQVSESAYPALAGHARRCELLPAFADSRLDFSPPTA